VTGNSVKWPCDSFVIASHRPLLFLSCAVRNCDFDPVFLADSSDRASLQWNVAATSEATACERNSSKPFLTSPRGRCGSSPHLAKSPEERRLCHRQMSTPPSTCRSVEIILSPRYTPRPFPFGNRPAAGEWALLLVMCLFRAPGLPPGGPPQAPLCGVNPRKACNACLPRGPTVDFAGVAAKNGPMSCHPQS
jgi:hypothetical protein